MRHVEMRDIVKCFPGVVANSRVCFDVAPGEVHALLGENGAGKSTLMRQLYGLYQPDEGEIFIDGKRLLFRSPADAIREFSVRDNIFLHDHSSAPYAGGIFLRLARMQEHATALVREFAVKTPGLDTPLKNLSGGNIQKLIMARELSRHPSVLIAAQPTRGVDISATGYIHQRLLMQREAGIGILLISEDLDEIRALSDRIAVMYEGRITGVLARGQDSVEQIGLMMAGISMEEALRS